MSDNSTEKFAQWREHLQRTYGRNTIVTKSWLRAQLAICAETPSAQREPFGETSSNELPESLAQIHSDLGPCTRCKLCEGRGNIVFGEGAPHARLMFVGEGPGAEEDEHGRPFVGEAGQLLDKIIEAMGLARAEVYLTSVVKCRRPSERDIEFDEAAACEPFLFRQFAAVRPEVVVALGDVAMKALLRDKAKGSGQRGIFMDYRGVKLMPTFDLAFLLRSPDSKKEAWEDFKKVKAELGMK